LNKAPQDCPCEGRDGNQPGDDGNSLPTRLNVVQYSIYNLNIVNVKT